MVGTVGFRNGDLVAKNITFDYTTNPQPGQPGIITANGQLLIGSIGSFPNIAMSAGNIVSPNGTVTIGYSFPNITIDIFGGAQAIERLTGNTGVATPISNNINVITENTTVKFVGTSGNLTQDFNLTNLFIGTAGASLLGGSGGNVAIGKNALVAATSATFDVAIGEEAGKALTSGSNDVYIGYETGLKATTGNSNTVVGSQSFNNYTTSGSDPDGNTILGAQSGTNIATGRYNTIVGVASGNTINGADSSNILIMHAGVSGESHATRIGTQGSGIGQQTDCYLAGVLHTTSGITRNITAPGAYPYAVLSTDDIVSISTASARTINLPNAPTTGTVYVLKDVTGSAAVNNISITTAGGVVTIDGATTYTINSNYGSIAVYFNGVSYFVI